MPHKNSIPSSYDDWVQRDFGASTAGMASALEFAAFENKLLGYTNPSTIAQPIEVSEGALQPAEEQIGGTVHQFVRRTGSAATKQTTRVA